MAAGKYFPANKAAKMNQIQGMMLNNVSRATSIESFAHVVI